MASPHPFRHRVEHTRNKHSRAICRGDTIIIRLARNLTKIEEQEHISSLLRRMTHLLLEERQKIAIDPFRHLLSGGQTQTVRLATGKRLSFELYPATRTHIQKRTAGWRIGVGPRMRRAALHRLLWSLIARSERERIAALVHHINQETFRTRIADVRVAFATTQWGSCSPKGVIMLNAALLFLPPSLLHYVVVHELAHRRVPNHSETYWREVQWALPGYKRAYRTLQGYRLPSL
jgi:predicted metal-dependent hydrolase